MVAPPKRFGLRVLAFGSGVLDRIPDYTLLAPLRKVAASK
jgi:hypothetical protein